MPIVVVKNYSENCVLLEDVWTKDGVENKFSFVKNPSMNGNVFFLPVGASPESAASLLH